MAEDKDLSGSNSGGNNSSAGGFSTDNSTNSTERHEYSGIVTHITSVEKDNGEKDIYVDKMLSRDEPAYLKEQEEKGRK